MRRLTASGAAALGWYSLRLKAILVAALSARKDGSATVGKAKSRSGNYRRDGGGGTRRSDRGHRHILSQVDAGGGCCNSAGSDYVAEERDMQLVQGSRLA